ncbi:glycosyltransferase family 61 protein [Panacagrimonas sp.]|uniref:glycosyltransferase family 61 protein n=1 Tax=Panacagrimonas sp. TaxID=2480088 RepID=UPI003B517812
MFRQYLIANNIQSLFVEPCTYTRRNADSAQIVLNVPSCLGQIAGGARRRTTYFSILAPGPVDLRGFRAYTNEQNQFFLDETNDPGWSRASFATRFAARDRFEDFDARWSGEKVELPDLVVNKRITEPVLSLCSAEPSNYGSWIYRIIPKLASVLVDDRALFLYAHSRWQRELLDYFAPRRRFLGQYPRFNYSLSDALIPTMRNRGVLLDDQTRAFYRRHAESVPRKSDMRRVYLSRRAQKIRPMLNEADLEGGLRSKGFDIIQPEALTLTDRIRVIRDAEVIVCPGGSGLFNLVFALNAKLVLDIEASKTWIFAHSNLMNSLELPHVLLIGDQVKTRNQHAEWIAPVNEAMRCLDQLM